ncbi:class F sortase [Streptomyces sp. NPDC047971]|uniref:class F sortase n=1 Tax=Streptomyces sp. NPDC047971 TaxID=3154499 RepID=UPI0033DB6101
MAVVLLVGIHLVRGGTDEWRAGGPPQPVAAAAPDGSNAAAAPDRTDADASDRTDADADADAPDRTDADAPDHGAAPGRLPASRPVRVRIPEVRVDAPVTEVGRDAEGAIDTPPAHEKNLAGWYTGAVTPGEPGTAVVVGHVDTPEGRAVFYELGALNKGDRVEIAREDGRTAVFSVHGVEVVPREGFPAERVYRPGALPELRLITCGGAFTRERGYEGNVVVFARLAAVR